MRVDRRLGMRVNALAKEHDLFEKASVPAAVAKSTVPAICSTLVILVYNLADTYFIGQTQDPMQVAAISLATPVFLLLTALGILYGVGGATLISRSLGRSALAYGSKVSSFCFWASVATGAFVAIGFWLGMDGLLWVIGASAETACYVREYLNIIALGAPFVVLTNTFSSMFRATGKPVEAMLGMVIGTILNIVLDPVMILALGWGVSGAALATVIGNIANTVFYLAIILKGDTLLSVSPKMCTVRERILVQVLGIGVPAALGSILMSVANVFANNMIVAYGDMAVAAFGVSQKIVMIVVYILQGYGIGVQPLLGYCYGAGNWHRFKKIMHLSYGAVLVLSLALLAVCWGFSEWLVKAFIDNSEVREYGVMFTKVMLIATPPVGFLFVFTSCIQAMGKAKASLVLALAQRGFFYLPILPLLQKGWGLIGIVGAQLIADTLSFLLAWVFYLIIAKRDTELLR